jgi:uncharacterized protein (DUF1330 family)
MSAYLVLDITVNDAQTYERYKQLAPPAIAAYGGQYRVRGGELEVLEGDWRPNRLVIVEFESVAKAKAFLASPEYAEALSLRHQAAISHAVVVEGL